MPRVDAAVYTSGNSETQQENALKLLIALGVREVGEPEHVEAILTQRYTSDAGIPDERTYRKDLMRFIDLLEDNPKMATLFKDFFIVCCEGDEWRRPSEAFLDQPFLDTGLRAYHQAIGEGSKPFALVTRYEDCEIELDRLASFFKAVGVQTRLEPTEVSCESNPEWSHLSSVGGERRTELGIDRDYVIKGLEGAFANPSLAISKLVWRTMNLLERRPPYLKARYSTNRSGGAHEAHSQLVHQLRNSAWVPQGNGLFVRPGEAASNLLPEGFLFDLGFLWLKAIQFGQKSKENQETVAEAIRSVFKDHANFERAKQFSALAPEEQERILAAAPTMRPILPVHEPVNSSRRADRVGEQARFAPERRTAQRSITVSVGLKGVKQKAARYLVQQYTNADGEMFCQLCKAPMPFKLDEGSYYFEKVEFLRELRKRHYQNYLALCPNHAAMFQHANGSADLLRDEFARLKGSELKVVLAQKDTTIYFTKTHAADMKSVIVKDCEQPEDCAEENGQCTAPGDR